MKTRLVAIITTVIVVSSVFAYLYDQMYDCLNPPMWIKIPRTYGINDCLQMYSKDTLPDWTKEREKHAKEQEHREEMIELFSDIPEVVAFYEKYEDANVSVRDDHVSYFAGNEDDFRIRMNLEFNENYEIENIELHCYVDREHQSEVAQSFILKYLKDYTCAEYGSQRNEN